MLTTLSPRDWVKAIALGLINGITLSMIMLTMKAIGATPLPSPLGLAFAETLLGRPLPLPVGLLFHLAYVTAW